MPTCALLPQLRGVYRITIALPFLLKLFLSSFWRDGSESVAEGRSSGSVSQDTETTSFPRNTRRPGANDWNVSLTVCLSCHRIRNTVESDKEVSRTFPCPTPHCFTSTVLWHLASPVTASVARWRNAPCQEQHMPDGSHSGDLDGGESPLQDRLV